MPALTMKVSPYLDYGNYFPGYFAVNIRVDIADPYYGYAYGTGWQSSYVKIDTNNPPYEFASVPDAITYWKPLLSNMALTAVSGLFPTLSFTLGNYEPVDQYVIDYSQPLSGNLNDFSLISMSPDVKAMMTAANSAAIAGSIGLNTAAFQPSSAFKSSSYVPAWTDVTGKPAFATVATTGAYNDLTGKPSIPSAVRTTSTFSPSLVTSTSGGGTQVSSIKDSTVRVSIKIDTSVSLSGNATGYVLAEIAPTNSSTAGDWVTYARVDSGQAGTLVIGLVLNQNGGGQLNVDVPAGYYVRFRTVNTAGTPIYTVTSGQKTIYG